ncbi:MAG TPA: methionine--tRNA ligase [Thermoplasmata archaeon]|nr:methionine--tRNA ligase [Thermoplasmata archaeon]
MARILVCLAWPYANGPFHIGHLAGSYLPGDIFARFHRLLGDEVLMVSGSDMHGTPILVRAEKEGRSAASVAEEFDRLHRETFRRLGFSFDLYTHTRTVLHASTVQELFLALLENGYVGRRTEENAYCPKHERFLPDRYLVGTCPHCGFEQARGDECDNCGRVIEPKQLGNPRCALCGTPAIFRPSEHFYLQLDKLQPAISEYLAGRPKWRDNVVGVTRNFLDQGLHPTPITRDLDWGVPIPLEGYDTKRFYVWFDALIGYLSASREWAVRAGKPDAWRRFWDVGEPVRQYYFIGKDNIFFHTVFLPGILLGSGKLQVPYDVPANEWMVLGGQKLSKSRAGPTDPTVPALLDRYPADAVRFYATALAPENHDTEFDGAEFQQLYDEVLANQWGNLVQRVLVLVRDKLGGTVPPVPDGYDLDAEGSVGARLRRAHEEITRAYSEVHLKEALELALGEIREANRRFHDAAPWRASGETLSRVLFEAVWTVRAVAVWTSPVLPTSSAEVARMLGDPEAFGPGRWKGAVDPPEGGRTLAEIRPLFPRQEKSGSGRSTPAAGAGPAPFAIAAARIEAVTPHPKADKLYLLELATGSGRSRTVVAGIRPFYAPEELVGRRLLVLTNLAPRAIRGETSNGMILAGDRDGRAVLVAPPDGVAEGMFTDGGGTDSRTITYDDFDATPLVVGRVARSEPGGTLAVDVGGKEVAAEGVALPGRRVIVRLAERNGDRGSLLLFREGGPVEPDERIAPGTRIR